MNFVPNAELDLSVSATNTRDEAINITIQKTGELAEYITFLGTTSYFFQPGETNKFDLVLNLPENFEKPGYHLGELVISEVMGSEGGMLSAFVGGIIPVSVFVPYPGKYAEISNINIENPNINQSVRFSVTVSSLGVEGISNAKCLIKIYDSNNRLITELETDSKSIGAQSGDILYATWFSSVSPGDYRVDVTLQYDGQEAFLSKNFRLGLPSIEILEIKSDPIPVGSIGKITTTIKNGWSQRIGNVYLEIKIRDATQLTSPTISIGEWEEKTIDVFWDTTNAQPKEYEAIATLYYLNKTEEKTFKIVVKKAGFDFNIPIEIIALIIIIILAIVVFLLKRKLRRKR
jgi:flagellar hook assembly protein FlgD